MKQSQLAALFIALFLVVALVACAAPAPAPTPSPAPAPAPQPVQPIQWKFAHQNPPQSRTTLKYIDPLAKRIEAATGGKLKMTMYPAESLFKGPETLEAVKGGMADISWVIGGYFPGRFPLTQVTALPFLTLPSGKIDGRSLYGGPVNSHIAQELYETLPEIRAEWKDFQVLFLYASDPYFLATTKKPVRNMQDLKGLKLRELGGPASDMWKNLGASPLLKPVTEVYENADKGVIDGAGVAWAMIVSYKLNEVFQYWTDAATTGSFFGIIVNKESWNKLPPDIQKEIMSAGGMAGAEFAGEAQFGSSVKDETLAAVEKSGKRFERVPLDPGEYERWIETAGKPVWKQWAADLEAKGQPGQKVLDEMLRLINKYK